MHSYAGPLLLGLAALATDVRSAALVGLAWAFHVGVDRAFGYGLKLPTSFQDTHLGRIGRPPSGA